MDILEEMNYRVQHRIVSSTRLRGDNWDAILRGAWNTHKPTPGL